MNFPDGSGRQGFRQRLSYAWFSNSGKAFFREGSLPEKEFVDRVVRFVLERIAHADKKFPEGFHFIPGNLEADKNASVIGAVIAVMEKADIPGRLHAGQEAHQRTRPFGEFKAVKQLVFGQLANQGIKKDNAPEFTEAGEKYGWNTFIPDFQYCTDNAGMIAITGYYKYLAGEFSELSVPSAARATW